MASLFDQKVSSPTSMGSYSPNDVTFLLKDLSNIYVKETVEDCEETTDYAKVLHIEYEPSDEYMALFYETLNELAEKIALAVGTVSEMILCQHGKQLVLASLRSGGTSTGVLIKRYLKMIHHDDIPHYSLGTFTNGIGIDRNALIYMAQHHPRSHIQFVDGWTGKGAACKSVSKDILEFNGRYNIHLSDDIAVLADTGHCTETFGTREDFLIPSALLLSNVSGLVSRVVIPDEHIGPEDFYGAKYYKTWAARDVSNLYVDTISSKFFDIASDAKRQADIYRENPELRAATWKGISDIKEIQERFHIPNIALIKPGVSETARVLLKRTPWKVLVKDTNNPFLKNILKLANERNAQIEIYPNLTYACCGLIKP